MKKPILLTILCIIIFAGAYYASAFIPVKRGTKVTPFASNEIELSRLKTMAAAAKLFTRDNGYSTKFCFLLDMSLGSGQNRFFVYDLASDSILMAGLVAHGSCNKDFLLTPK